MSVSSTEQYKRVIVLTFGAGAAAILLYLIVLNATSEYEMSTLTLVLLASIIFSTLGVDIYALQDSAGRGGE